MPDQSLNGVRTFFTAGVAPACAPLTEELLLRGMLASGMLRGRWRPASAFFAIKAPRHIDGRNGVYCGPPAGTVEADDPWGGYA